MADKELTQAEQVRRNFLKDSKPLVYEKIRKFDEKLKRGESIAIMRLEYDYACNLRCQHCSIRGFQGKCNKRALTIADVKNIYQQAHEMGLARAVITGGEPLVFRELDQLVAAIDPQKFFINMDTNGYLLDKAKAVYLKQIGVDRIQLSLDNLNAAEHDAFRGCKGAFARALKAIDAAREVGLDLFVQTVVTKQRLHSDEFIAFVEYFNAKGIGVFVSYAKPVGAWQGKFDMLIDRQDMAYMRELEKKHKVFTHLTPAYGLEMGCIAVKGMFSVTKYGDVLPCLYIHTSIGNVFDEPLKDIVSRGMKIKWFGERIDTCLIAEDRPFIDKYVAGRIDGRPLPVPWQEVFTEEDFIKK